MSEPIALAVIGGTGIYKLARNRKGAVTATRIADQKTVDVPVDLPGSTAAPSARPKDPVYLTLGRDLTLSLAETAVARDRLAAELDRVTGGDRETRVYLRADAAVPYGDLMAVMDLLRGAAYLKVALVGIEALPGTTPATAAGMAAGTPGDAVR